MSDPLRAALESALVENPDDVATHMAYADLLVEQGDPRGELIQAQLALEDPAVSGERRKDLQAREKELLDAHQRDWLGELAPHALNDDAHESAHEQGIVNRITWARGWLHEVHFWLPEVPTIRALVRCPAARLLRRLSLRETYDEESDREPDDGIPDGSAYPILYPLWKAPFLPHLSFFRLGEEVDFEESFYNCEADGEGFIELMERTPALEELEIYAYSCEPEELFALTNLTRLRSLIFYHNAYRYPLDVLADNPAFAALQTLRIHPAHTRGSPSYLPRAEVVRLVNSPHLASLRHLHLHASDLGDEGCKDIVESGILKRLKTLDLRHGCVTDRGAHTLAECPDVRNLDFLSLANNQLTDEGEQILKRLGIAVRVGLQHEEGSEEYLWTGDTE